MGHPNVYLDKQYDGFRSGRHQAYPGERHDPGSEAFRGHRQHICEVRSRSDRPHHEGGRRRDR